MRGTDDGESVQEGTSEDQGDDWNSYRGARCIFRIPGGEYNNEVLRTIYACGSYPVAWSVDSMDWKEYEASELVRQLLQSCTIRDGEILRFHGEGENTGEMVKLLHPRLKEEGYEAVTVSQMVYKDRYRMTTDGRQIPEKSK